MTNATEAIDPPLGDRVAQLWAENIAWVSNHSTQIILAALIGAFIVAGLMTAKWVGQRIYASAPKHDHWRTTFGKALSKTRLWFMVAVAAQVIAAYADAPPTLARTINFVFVVAATLQAAVFARAVLLGVIEHRARSADEHAALASAMGIIRLLLTFGLFAIAAIFILSNLGVNVTGLIAGLGVGGIAIGLAAQGIFADLFAALAILFDRPFRKGDAIRYDSTSGSVEDIGLKSTRIRALTGEQIIIANKQLLEKEIHNLARLDRRRIVTTYGLIYQTPVETLDRIPAMMSEIISGCSPATLVRCGMTAFGASSVDFELQYDVHSEDYDVVFATRHAVSIAILRRFANESIEFAYPTQTAFTAAPDGKYIMPYAAPSEPNVIKAQ
ncbi:MAG: mechanosensitive ion channel family protein [Sphingomonas sp.]